MTAMNTPTTSTLSEQAPVSRNQLAWLEQQADHLQLAAEHELRAAGAPGLSELELIRALQSDRWQLIEPVSFNDPTALYPVHFLLFHSLYRLQTELAQTGEALMISPLRLCIFDTGSGSTQPLPAEEDPLRRYYLDLSRYFLSGHDIQCMMERFLAGVALASSSPEEVQEAAQVLGFEAPPADFRPVKQQFRRRVMQAHPDRGGRTEDIQELNRAFSVLKRHFTRR